MTQLLGVLAAIIGVLLLVRSVSRRGQRREVIAFVAGAVLLVIAATLIVGA